MTTLTVKDDQTASQALVAEGKATATVKDANGRTIEIRRVNMSIRRRVYKVISAENGSKEQYLGLAMLAACVTSIDGVPVPFPANEMQLDALIDRLDDPGFTAIAIGVQEHFGTTEDENAIAGE